MLSNLHQNKSDVLLNVTAPGLRAEYFALESRISRLSEIDFDRAPDAIGAVEALDLFKGDDLLRADISAGHFAARYTGGFEVAKAGRYTVHLTYGDGSALMIDGQSMIDNDGKHGTRERSVTLELEAGVHDLCLLYFAQAAAQTLQLEWQGPDTGGARTVMGGETLHHEGVEQPAETQESGSEVAADTDQGIDIGPDAHEPLHLHDDIPHEAEMGDHAERADAFHFVRHEDNTHVAVSDGLSFDSATSANGLSAEPEVVSFGAVVPDAAPAATAASETVFYVDPTAARNGDGSIDSPFNTWLGVVWEVGATYLQKAGTNFEGFINIDVAGHTDAVTRIGSYGAGDAPVVSGWVAFDGAAHVTLSGLTITESPYAGIAIMGGTSDVEISGVTVENNASGVWFASDAGGGNQIVESRIANNDGNGIAFAGTPGVVGRENTIIGNLIEFNGIHGVDVHANNVQITDNVVFANGGSVPGASGIHVYGADPAEQMGYDNYIARNVAYGNLDNGGNDGIGILLDHYTGRNVVENNIAFSNDGVGIGIYGSEYNTIHENIMFGNLLDRSETHTLKAEFSVNTAPELGENLTSGNVITENTILSYNEDSFAFFVDAESAKLGTVSGGNVIQHGIGGDVFFWGEQGVVELSEWNRLAAGAGDDRLSGVKIASAPVGGLEHEFQDDFGLPINGRLADIVGWDSEVGLVGDWLM